MIDKKKAPSGKNEGFSKTKKSTKPKEKASKIKKSKIRKKTLPQKKVSQKTVIPKPEKLEESPKKTATFTSVRSKKKRGLMLPLGVAVVILIVAAGFYQSKQLDRKNLDRSTDLDTKISSEVGVLQKKLEDLVNQFEQQKKESEENKTQTSTYQITELGLEFDYPASLGEVSVEILANVVEENIDLETTTEPQALLRLTFLANPDIWFTAVTADYTGEEPFVYIGNIENLANECDDALTITKAGYCDSQLVSGQPAYEQTETYGEESLVNVVKHLSLNLSHPNYKGLSINLGLGLPPVASRSIFKPSTEDEQTAALGDFYKNLIKGEGLSLVVQENLAAYKTIVESLRVVEVGS